MTFDHSQLIPVLPEIILLAGASLVLLVDLFTPRDTDRMWPYTLTLATLSQLFAATALLPLALFRADLFLAHLRWSLGRNLLRGGAGLAASLHARLYDGVIGAARKDIHALFVRLAGRTIDVVDVAVLVDPLEHPLRLGRCGSQQGGQQQQIADMMHK
mgnify:CR=1 FL=1